MRASLLYIVRHAECKSNVAKIVLPPAEDVLTEHGKLQANLLGKHLESIEFTKVFSSDYSRCKETASCILSASKYPKVTELKIEEDERLRERNLGIYEGGTFEKALQFMGENIFEKGIPATEIEIPGGDSSIVMHQRAKSFFNDILKVVDNSEKESETILATTHGLCMLYLVHYLMNSADQVKLINYTGIIAKAAPNTAVIKLSIYKKPVSEADTTPRKIDVLAEHDRSHLTTLPKQDPVGSFVKGSKFDGCVHQ